MAKPLNQYQLNLEIEKFIREKDAKADEYSKDDIAYILQYEGSGGQGRFGAKGKGVLYEFYTPDFVVDIMWELAYKYGYSGGNVLEPSIATGRLIRPAPDKSKCVGFEINPVTARISKIVYPEATIHNGYFETAFMESPRFTNRLRSAFTWLEEYPFQLVIGNPPYGRYQNKYSPQFQRPKMPQIELFFIYYGLMLLQKGGILLYLISSNFLRNGIAYNKAKEDIAKIADISDAYRLPPVFRFSEVPVDILILKRK